MRFRRTMSVMIAAAMLTSTFCAVGSLGASAAQTEDNVSSIVASDYSTYPTYSGNDLGASYTPEATTFKVWAPTSRNVTLNLYNDGGESSTLADADKKEMTLDTATGVWSVKVDGDLKNKYYTYTIENDVTDKLKEEKNLEEYEVCDIYAKAAGVNGNRAMVVDLDSTDPEGWENDNFQRVEEATDASVWEIHIKDFSYDPESGVSEQYRGKYMAFTELETTLNNAGDVKTCMNYLKDLGIKYVQINPMYDFGSVDEAGDDSQFNWGYDPKNYNVPEGSYSTNPYDGNVRITEMKQMIKALHDNGIGVIMDVVYNHTYASEDSWFNTTVPGYYYRQNASGGWSNGSGCGNDTASEREMFKKFMVESVTYWADEYHIDGFRFDLMGLHDVDTMNAVREELDKIDTRIITYGEGWNLSTDTDKTNWAGNKTTLCTQNKAFKANERIGFFNDTARDAIKGKAFDDLTSRGFVSGTSGNASYLYQSMQGMTKGVAWKTKAPTQNVMYACCHDNQTLWDRLVASTYGVDATSEQYQQRNEEFVAGNKLSSAIVLTSQGIPFMLAGEEFARTKLGDHNSYKSAADLNMLHWAEVEEYADIVAYYKGMMQIRDNFDAFSDGTTTSGNAMQRLETAKSVIGYTIPNLSSAQNQWDSAVLYFNASLTDEVEVTLPGGVSALMGDINENGENDSADALSILRKVVGLETYTAEQEAIADVDGDGAVSSNDALKVLRITVGLEEPVYKNSTEYVVIANDQTAGLSAIETVSGKATVKPTSALILIPKESYDNVNISDDADAFVVVNHIDSATGEVLRKITLKGSEGQKYTTQAANDLLVEYDLDSVEGNANGTMAKGTTEVNYKYSLFAGGIGKLTVKYVDQDGKDLADPTVSTARGGTAYTTEPKSFTWYELDEANLPENASGTYNKDGVEVVYRYIYNKPERSADYVTSTIHVKLVDTEFEPCVYIWDDVVGTNLPEAKGWPGTTLTEKDADGWYSFTFQNYSVYNWILNGGGAQTADMGGSGDIWVVATGSAANVEVFDHNPDA